MNSLYGNSLLDVQQLSRNTVDHLFKLATEFSSGVAGAPRGELFRNRIMATLFFEPSTRTRLSFEAAMLRLGGEVVSVADAATSSEKKGETLHDTVRTVSGYADLIVLRYPEVGSVRQAVSASQVPLINAGDGWGQHPSQALLDVYTMLRELDTVDGLSIVLAGDLKYGRTVHSLIELLSLFDVNLICASPKGLEMPTEIIARVEERGRAVSQVSDIKAARNNCDVLYMTSVPSKRFQNIKKYQEFMQEYSIDMHSVKEFRDDSIVLHPMPRLGEIHPSLDNWRGAAYFRQSQNGVAMRMAIIASILSPG